MTPKLLAAHAALDLAVDKAMGAIKELKTERERQEILFDNYSRMVG